MGGQTQVLGSVTAGNTVYIWREPTKWVMHPGGAYHIVLIASYS